MANKNTAVFGIYATPATAENGVDHLLTVGFTSLTSPSCFRTTRAREPLRTRRTPRLLKEPRLALPQAA
jgi:hypothetical protein